MSRKIATPQTNDFSSLLCSKEVYLKDLTWLIKKGKSIIEQGRTEDPCLVKDVKKMIKKRLKLELEIIQLKKGLKIRNLFDMYPYNKLGDLDKLGELL